MFRVQWHDVRPDVVKGGFVCTGKLVGANDSKNAQVVVVPEGIRVDSIRTLTHSKVEISCTLTNAALIHAFRQPWQVSDRVHAADCVAERKNVVVDIPARPVDCPVARPADMLNQFPQFVQLFPSVRLLCDRRFEIGPAHPGFDDVLVPYERGLYKTMNLPSTVEEKCNLMNRLLSVAGSDGLAQFRHKDIHGHMYLDIRVRCSATYVVVKRNDNFTLRDYERGHGAGTHMSVRFLTIEAPGMFDLFYHDQYVMPVAGFVRTDLLALYRNEDDICNGMLCGNDATNGVRISKISLKRRLEPLAGAGGAGMIVPVAGLAADRLRVTVQGTRLLFVVAQNNICVDVGARFVW